MYSTRPLTSVIKVVTKLTNKQATMLRIPPIKQAVRNNSIFDETNIINLSKAIILSQGLSAPAFAVRNRVQYTFTKLYHIKIMQSKNYCRS